MGAKTDDLGEGVFFASEDCAGLLMRFAILAIDLLVLVGCWITQHLIWSDVLEAPDPDFGAFWSWVIVAYVYLVVMESTVGTLGFFIAGVRIVGLNGEQPSFLRMTGRLLLWVLGPFNFLIDFLWLTNDRHKQTLRDKLAGTYVVKKDAIPTGKGRIRLVHYFLFGFSMLFPEVRGQGLPQDTTK